MKFADVPWATSLFTAPLREPLDVAEAKLQCRIEHDSEDAWVDDAIATARELTECFTGRAWINQTRDLVLDEFPSCLEPIRVPRLPLVSVTSIVYLDADGVSQTWNAFLYDAVVSSGRIAPKVGQVYPTTQAGRIAAVTVRYICGYGLTPATVPALARSAMKVQIEHWYASDEITNALLPAVCGLLEPLRVSW